MTRQPGVLSAGPRLAEKALAEKRVRQVRRLRRSGWLLAAGAVVGLASWVLLASSWLVVHTVVVEGERRLTAAQVLAAADVRLGTPLARVDTGAVADRVRRLGPVLSVSVTRSWPSTLTVHVVERTPVAAFALGKTWVLVDEGGTQLGTVPALPSGVVQLAVAQPGTADPDTRAALSVLQQLPKTLRALVSGIGASSPEQVTLVLVGDRRVVWGGTSDGPAKAAALLALLKLPGHLYDVSSPTVVTRR